MGENYIFQTIVDNLGIPILIAFGGAISLFIGKWADKIGNSIMIKNEIDSIEKRSKARKEILDALRPTVEAAVASNMQLANTMRERNGKLTDTDIAELNKSAKELVINTLPESLTSENGELLKILGGKEQLDAAIKVMIEQYVYEYKLKSSDKNISTSSKYIKTNKGLVYPVDKKIYKPQ